MLFTIGLTKIGFDNQTALVIWGRIISYPFLNTIISEVKLFLKKNNSSNALLFGIYFQQNNLTGGKLFEVDATNPSNITLEIKIFKEH